MGLVHCSQRGQGGWWGDAARKVSGGFCVFVAHIHSIECLSSPQCYHIVTLSTAFKKKSMTLSCEYLKNRVGRERARPPLLSSCPRAAVWRSDCVVSVTGSQPAGGREREQQRSGRGGPSSPLHPQQCVLESAVCRWDEP